VLNETPAKILWIKDARIAQHLLEPKTQEQLRPFMHTETSVTQASELLKLPFRSAYSMVKRLERYGLIRVARLESRDGRPIRFYRASAEKFFIPKLLVPFEQVMQIVNGDLEQEFTKQFIRATWGEIGASSGIQIEMLNDGNISCLLADGPNSFKSRITPERTATYGMWYSWRLDFGDAKALQQELNALAKKYATNANGAQKYLVRLAMTPVQAE
jgi:predicted transcriptional regulator